MESTVGSKRKRTALHILFWLMLGLCLLAALFPFYWMIITSFRPDNEMYVIEPNLLPSFLTGTLKHYTKLLTTTNFIYYFKNSIFISVVTTLLAVLVSYPAAFAVTKMRLKIKGFNVGGTVASLVLYTYLVPASVLFIPMFSFLSNLGIINTPWSLVVTYLTFTVPFCTWMMMGFLKKLPTELIEAAAIDGCSKLRSMYLIALPLVAPGIASSAIFAFTLSWNEYLYALVFITSDKLRTIPVGISSLIMGDVFAWGQIMASAVIAAIPAVALYIFCQRYVISGITAGSVKG